jgi:hypothetical protein
MAKDELRTVWVLGSGFSRPLGCPLLDDLLSNTAWSEIKRAYPETKVVKDPGSVAAVRLYHYGRNYALGCPDDVDRERVDRRLGERLWADAEDFLDALDAAARGGPKKDFLWGILMETLARRTPPADLGEVRAGAQRLVAVQCEMFTSNADTKTERWMAHVNWSKQLDHCHRIITFNYDRVLEKPGLREAMPTWQHGQWIAKDAEGLGTWVYMLHGSVRWARKPSSAGHNKYVEVPEDFAANCESSELAIAAPGPSKKETAAVCQPEPDERRRVLVTPRIRPGRSRPATLSPESWTSPTCAIEQPFSAAARVNRSPTS